MNQGQFSSHARTHLWTQGSQQHVDNIPKDEEGPQCHMRAHTHTRTHTVRSGLFFFFFPSAQETHHKSSSPKVGFPNAQGRRDSVAATSADESYRSHKSFAQQGGCGEGIRVPIEGIAGSRASFSPWELDCLAISRRKQTCTLAESQRRPSGAARQDRPERSRKYV